jgi:hypothetical protein
MARFIISCDQITQGYNYAGWTNELARLQSLRLMDRVWGANVNATSVELREHLKKYLGTLDRLIVIDRDGPDWAAWNLMGRLDHM